jgi:hypothetical protein
MSGTRDLKNVGRTARKEMDGAEELVVLPHAAADQRPARR